MQPTTSEPKIDNSRNSDGDISVQSNTLRRESKVYYWLLFWLCSRRNLFIVFLEEGSRLVKSIQLQKRIALYGGFCLRKFFNIQYLEKYYNGKYEMF